jgi:hypothetical protein
MPTAPNQGGPATPQDLDQEIDPAGSARCPCQHRPRDPPPDLVVERITHHDTVAIGTRMVERRYQVAQRDRVQTPPTPQGPTQVGPGTVRAATTSATQHNVVTGREQAG